MISQSASDQSLQPWQFFVLAALACATAVTFIVRGQGLIVVVLLTLLMGAAALMALAVVRTIRPLVTTKDDRTVMIGDRTRAALEREKMLALRAIKELEFDRAMKKVSEDDFKEVTSRLRARAIRLIQQLDAGASYRDQIERELVRRMSGVRGAETKVGAIPVDGDAGRTLPAEGVCANCSTSNDSDAKFCKGCGAKL